MPKALSLFTGCGGIDIGLERAGFEIIGCVEIEEYACDTLRLNNPQKTIIGPPHYSGDIREVNLESLRDALGIEMSEIEVLVGGPPCQPFSAASMQRYLKVDDKYKRKGFKDDNLGTLLWEYLRLIESISPKCFIVENVPDFISGENKQEYELFIQRVKSSGYQTNTKVLLTSDFGVPQNRKRAFIVGWKKNLGTDFSYPEKTHFSKPVDGEKKKIGVAQAIYGLDTNCINHITRNHKPESLERYKTLAVGKREPKGRVDRLNPLMPGKTVIAGGKQGGGRSHLHPFEARTMSPRESARIQTFPDDYIFTGSIGRQFTQIGNAIPPLIGEILGRQIGRLLFDMEYPLPPSLLPQNYSKNEIEKIVAELRNSSKKSLLYNDLH